MNIVVVGQGAIGSLLSAKLIKHRHINLSTLSTSVNKNTHHLSHFNYSFTHHNGLSEEIQVSHAYEQELREAEVVLVCIKAPHIRNVVKQLLAKLQDQITIILCHNGMGTIDELTPFLSPSTTVLSMITTQGAFRPTKTHTIHTGLGSTELGIVKGVLDSSYEHRLFTTLNEAIDNVIWQNNIQEKMWLKLAINSIINPITAINNIQNGQLLQAEFPRLINALSEEVSKVVLSQGISLSTEFIIQTVKNVATNTANNRSSMLCDITQNQPTEIDYINGYLIKIAHKHGILVPNNEMLYSKVKALELN